MSTANGAGGGGWGPQPAGAQASRWHTAKSSPSARQEDARWGGGGNELPEGLWDLNVPSRCMGMFSPKTVESWYRGGGRGTHVVPGEPAGGGKRGEDGIPRGNAHQTGRDGPQGPASERERSKGPQGGPARAWLPLKNWKHHMQQIWGLNM